MRNALLGPCLLLFCISASAGDDDPRKIVDSAIKAHGGTDALERAVRYERDAEGVMLVLGKENPLRTTLIVSTPNRLRDKVELTAEGKKIALTRVLGGERGWENRGGATLELPREALQHLKDECYVLELATLVPLLAKDLALERIPDDKSPDKDTLGILVKGKDRPDVSLFFDKKSHLLVRIERPADDAGMEVVRSYLFSDHKVLDGIQVPTKYVEQTAGAKVVELTIKRFRTLPKIDDATFAKP